MKYTSRCKWNTPPGVNEMKFPHNLLIVGNRSWCSLTDVLHNPGVYSCPIEHWFKHIYSHNQQAFNTYKWLCTYMHTITRIHTYTFTRIYTHTHTFTHIHTHLYTFIHTYWALIHSSMEYRVHIIQMSSW